MFSITHCVQGSIYLNIKSLSYATVRKILKWRIWLGIHKDSFFLTLRMCGTFPICGLE